MLRIANPFISQLIVNNRWHNGSMHYVFQLQLPMIFLSSKCSFMYFFAILFSLNIHRLVLIWPLICIQLIPILNSITMVRWIITVQDHNISKNKLVFKKKQTPNFKENNCPLFSLSPSLVAFTSDERGYFTMIKREKTYDRKKKGNLHLNCDVKQCVCCSMNDCSRIYTFSCSSHNVYLYSLVQPSNIINFQFCTAGDDERVHARLYIEKCSTLFL